jgi:hypothetical protein
LDRVCPKCRRGFSCSGECLEGKEYRSTHSGSCLCPECLESTLVESIVSIFKGISSYDTGGSFVHTYSFGDELKQNINDLQRANTMMRKTCRRTRRDGTTTGESPVKP